MADIKITDSLSLTGDIKLSDNSKLAKAGLSEIVTATNGFVQQLAGPVNAAPFKSATFGAKLTAPNIIINSAASLAVNTTVTGHISIRTHSDKALFDDDGISPAIPITPDECWVGCQLDTAITSKLSATVNGFGASIGTSASVSFFTFAVQHADNNGAFPSLRDALGESLSKFSPALSPNDLRAQTPGTVNSVEVSGSIKIAGSYQFPVSVDALASANMPFNYSLNVVPGVTLKVGGELALSGDWVIRYFKINDSELRIGCYKTKGSTVTASFTAGADIQANIGQQDLVAAFFGAVLPTVDLDKAGVTGDSASQFKAALKDSIDRSLSFSINAQCSASQTDEAAVFCTVNLAGGDSADTDAALADALGGDWTHLVALPNAIINRNVLQTTEKQQTTIKINLLGIYNAESAESFVQQCTVIHDDSGAVTVTDKVTASQITVASTPLAADPEKLRLALAQSFLATAVYAASRAGISGTDMSLVVSQSFFECKAQMDRQSMANNLLVGSVLGLFSPGTWDHVLAANTTFSHALITASAKYDQQGIMTLFFSDPQNYTCRSLADYTTIGRQMMAALIDSADPTSRARLSALNSDTIWVALDETGNMNAFSTIPYLSHCSPNEIADIEADWADVTWWANAMSAVGPALSDLLIYTKSLHVQDPTTDSTFETKRVKLAHVLAQVAKRSRAAFSKGWGLAAMYRSSNRSATLDMNISAHELQSVHYSRPSMLTV